MKMLMSWAFFLKKSNAINVIIDVLLIQHSSCASPNFHTLCLLVSRMQMLKLSVATHASEKSSL